MLPTLIVIGGMKCGTTSLHYYLDQHPEIAMSRTKELNFFIAERNWERGIAWYEAQFAERARHRGESSPNYTCYPLFDGVSARMWRIVPGARLIYLVRDPVDRIVSDWVHRTAAGNETRTLVDSLADLETSGYVARSRYHAQLERFLAHYPPSQVLVVPTEDLREQRAATMRRIFRFLEVDDTFTSRRFGSVRHRTDRQRRRTTAGERLARSRALGVLHRFPPDVRWRAQWLLTYPFSRRVEPPPVPEWLRLELLGALSADAESLRRSTGLRLEKWCV